MSYTIYLVEDEENLNELLTKYLESEGWHVTSFLNGESARQHIGQSPHLWILDIMLPDIDGYALIKEIKNEDPDVPVIFISARDADIDRVLGLELGSSDYISKPFLPRELIIRVQKLLKLIYKKDAPDHKKGLSVAKYRVFESLREVYEDDKKISLTSKEFDLLLLFMNNQGRAFSREDILTHVWGEDYFGTDRVVDDLVRRLRKKMPDLKVETIYGFGYRMLKA
ncbi:transcriptional regulator [Bacillus glycinifermentans]|uniref:Response regulator transcription factor n=1 Tax=Bacillus glycinifermentans TaxID=1664069 RepID=A0A0J6EUP5_9BACI|nr:response regulator transcription factor [Bacillus glycinifermentans]ATH93081.1 DNA-binding response regulator [Bacillus glycinifermentans]KMM56237.1 transcriptional regulator [Bacillus glycinifermentans]KRT94324.1 two-component system response regulator [Bacillus glycinifermentans]MEC0485853.1 response regulator transcription factor [Bacillus glycinifermentans]MEC0495679.1 response regulator transcription factor [Bacillus glycinifermentans]